MNNWKIEGKSKRNIWKVLLVIKILFFFFFFTTRKLLEVPFKASAFNFIPISLKLIKLANEDFDESENERLLSSQLKIYIYIDHYKKNTQRHQFIFTNFPIDEFRRKEFLGN